MGTFLCSPYNLVNNREGSAVRWRQFALVYGITDFEGYKNRTRSQNKTKDGWISHLDIVRYHPTVEVKGRFNSCLSSKCSAVSAHTGLALKSPCF